MNHDPNETPAQKKTRKLACALRTLTAYLALTRLQADAERSA